MPNTLPLAPPRILRPSYGPEPSTEKTQTLNEASRF